MDAWAAQHLRPRDVAAWAALPLLVALGVTVALAPGLADATRAAGVTGALGAVTTVVGYDFGRGQADKAHEAAEAARQETRRVLFELERAREMASAAKAELETMVEVAATAGDAD